MNRIKKAAGKLNTYRKKKLAAMAIAMTLSTAHAETTPTLDINFDVTEMFTWAQTIINAMLPVVYIIMGVALGFLIIRAFKSAFN